MDRSPLDRRHRGVLPNRRLRVVGSAGRLGGVCEPSRARRRGRDRGHAQGGGGSPMLIERYQGGGEEWDGVVRGSSGWSPFQLYGWRDVMEGVFGHECLYLGARDGAGRLAGVLPLVRVKSLLFGHYLVSMPFVNYGGPVGTEAAVRALVAHAVGLAREQHVELLELRCREPLPVDLPMSHRKITVVLDLPAGGPDAVWQTFTSNVRRKIRRAQKERLSVRFGLDQVTAFYQVFSHHMRDLVERCHLIQAKPHTESLFLSAPDLATHVRRERLPHGVRTTGGEIEDDRDLSVGHRQIDRQRFATAKLEQLDMLLTSEPHGVRHQRPHSSLCTHGAAVIYEGHGHEIVAEEEALDPH